METRSGVFAVAITVLLLMALTMNSVSAESKAKVKLGPTDADKMKLNHTDRDKMRLNHSDVAKEILNHTDAAKEKLNHTDAAKVALNPSESMPFPTERVLNELIYDDGTAEDAYAWDSPGNGFAVQFTPPTYPVDLRTARICFWPDWPDSNHEEFAVYVYDDDGPGGEPGTCLGGPIYHTATAWGWCDVDISGLGITIENGDFYILYKQLTDSPDCEGLCRDLSLPQYGRSWDYVSGSWDLWNENYMIRCVVDGDATDEWTYMVYLDGDNNLEGAGIDDFLEMSSVYSTSDVNIVVQFDRIPGYDSSYGDWEDCKRFHVTYGMTPMPANALINLGECNMGDPNTLRDFVEWTMTNFPADNYALILWNHGSGWKSINRWVPWADDLKDAKDAGVTRGICVDNTNNDYLSLQETEVALTGKYVQLLGYDACLMHMIEVVYQVRTNAGVSVGSEEPEPGDGWPYDTILNDLTVTPTMNEDALGTVIVDRYMASYPTPNDLTQSAMDNSALPNLVAAVDNLAQALMTEINGGHWTQVQQARYATEEIYYNYYIDLYHFAQKIKTDVPGAAIQAQAVMGSMGVAVYAEAHGTWVPNDHGLSIYFPRVEGDYLASYDNTAFASDTQWNEFLKRYYEGPELVCEGTATSCGIYPNCENCNNYDGWYCNGNTREYRNFYCSGTSCTYTVTSSDNCNNYDGCSAYSNGCENRDYYCSGGSCEYTHSNRHTDYYDDWDYYCDGDTVRRHRLFHDYYCDGGTCTDHTSLVDDQLVENCNDHDGWVDTGNKKWVPDPGNDCQEKERKEQEYRDYYCSGGACTYSVTGTQWVDTGTTRNKPDIRQPISPIRFGDVIVGNSRDKTTTIYNDCTAILTVNNITRSSGSSDFSYIGPSTPFDIAAGASRTITVRFAPISTGSKSANFIVNSNDPDEANVPFSVSGDGTPQVGEGTPVAYLKKGSSDRNYDLLIYTAPTTIREHGTLIASDYWSPDGSTVGISAIGLDEIAYLKKGSSSDRDYDLLIYTAPTTIREHGTLIASDYWSPDGSTVAITAIDINGDGVHEIAYLKKGSTGDRNYDLFIYSAPTTIREHGTLIASDFWSPDGSTAGITAIDINGDGVDEIAYLKKGSTGERNYDLYIYSAPTTIREHGTLIASDFWSPDGNTVGIAATDIDGDGVHEIAYLKKGSTGDRNYDLFIYSAPTTIREHGTLIASDYWSPDGQTEGISALW